MGPQPLAFLAALPALAGLVVLLGRSRHVAGDDRRVLLVLAVGDVLLLGFLLAAGLGTIV